MPGTPAYLCRYQSRDRPRVSVARGNLTHRTVKFRDAHVFARQQTHGRLVFTRAVRGRPHAMLDGWRDELLNYFDHRYSNGNVEGKSNRTKQLRRQRYGYRNRDNLRLRALLPAA